MKILLAGGGTLGPVTPLLAMVESWRKRDAEVSFLLAGTPDGPERALAQAYGLAFVAITPVRFPRFFSCEWFVLPVRVVVAFFQSWKLLRRERPDLIFGAGGYSQVPVIFVGWLFRIPSSILQTDVLPLLSNRLSIPFVRNVFVGWDETLRAFPASKTKVVGVPARASLLHGSRERALQHFGLDAKRPTLLVLGGGTGSLWINERLAEIAPQLSREMNVIHITGRGKNLDALRSQGRGYAVIGHVEEGLKDIYAAADLVVARAGMGTISELSALKKPAIIIPLPGSAQEANASALQREGAAVICEQETIGSVELLHEIRRLMADTQERKRLGEAIHRVLNTNFIPNFFV